jgi:hypothetical protein
MDPDEPRDESDMDARRRERREQAAGWAEAQRRAWRARRARRAQTRKERVVHTRVSDELHAAIQRVSEELRVPVSNLIRNSLEDAFRVGAAVGELVDELVEKARARGFGPAEDADADASGGGSAGRAEPGAPGATSAAAGGAPAPGDRSAAPGGANPSSSARAAQTEPILGWQPLVLYAAQSCEVCADSLDRGADAYVAVSPSGLTARYACPRCVRARF